MTLPTYSTYQQINFSPDYSYKLLQLNPELLNYLKQGEGELLLKAPNNNSNHIVLCTENKTWKLRQMNHSNTVLLLNDVNNDYFKKTIDVTYPSNSETKEKLVGFSSLSYEYELNSISGYVDTRAVPIYDGQVESINQRIADSTVVQLCENSPISKVEFYKEWYKLCGSSVNDIAVILSREFVTEALLTLITILISKKINVKDDSDSEIELDLVATWMHKENAKYDQNITTTILHKFGTERSTPNFFKLHNSSISTWFGIQTLHNTRSNTIADKEFLLQWRSLFPPFYNAPIDLKQLKGYYFRPLPGRIQYLNPSSLSDSDLHGRVKELFQIANEWDFSEFLPFIQKFIPSGQKPEKLILKYAKRKKVGKDKFLVSPR